jgi:hypothetical protein
MGYVLVMTIEILKQVSGKQQELGADVPLNEVVAALLRDAVATWKEICLLVTLGGAGAVYPNRVFARRLMVNAQRADNFCATVIEAIESGAIENVRALVRAAGLKPRKLPSAEAVRRLRVVTAELPPYLRGVTNRGLGADGFAMWRLLWFDALGMTAPKIAMALFNSDPEALEPVQRVQIWRLRRKALAKIAAGIELEMVCHTARFLRSWRHKAM